jgi:hypothetical protein
MEQPSGRVAVATGAATGIGRVDLVIYPGALHAFDYAPVPAAERALDDSVAFIRSCIDGAHAPGGA